ncbi:MAG: hypothetical protein K2L00_08720 [Muribaculaceae bacterium]|nr:hypothetical protein [Muribaculaceae bacterium]
MKAANSRILKNTGLLYFRLIFLTFINLYAVRITLEALGQIDYGVFNVIASVVASLSILTGAMTSATQRFLSFHLGKEDYHSYSHTFTLLLMSFGAMAAVLVLIGECLGYFLIEKWLEIPPDRYTAAYWVFQTSLLAFALGLITIPYTSSIVANERMGAFAAFSIVEGVCRLGTALILIVYGGDRLILYGILTAATSAVVFLMSLQYCHSKFAFCRYIWKWNKSIFSQLSGYIGWNMFGSISAMLATQGQNILLNIFFGPVINAAKAIADRIQHVISGFSINLYMAASPQIIKSYAAGELDRCRSLVLKTSKMSFLLVFVMAFPLICNMEGLLRIWLAHGDYSTDMTAFSKLILVYCLVLTLEPPLSRIIQATGDIRRYQISVGAITLSFIPIAALVLWMGAGAVFTLVVLIAVMAVAQVVRVIVAHRQVGLAYADYWKMVMVPLLKVSIVGIPLYLVFDEYFQSMDWMLVILQTAVAGIAGLFVGGVLGLDSADRKMLSSLIKNKLKWK